MSEMIKLLTISQPFYLHPQPKLNGFHNFLEEKIPTVAFSPNVSNYFAGHLPDETFFVDSQSLCTNLTNSQPIPDWQWFKSYS